MNRVPLRVVKLGGSLLGRPELPSSLQRWLGQQPPWHTMLLVGGGPLADWVRAADRVHHLGDEASHWLAVSALSVTARLVAELLPAARLMEDWFELQQLVASTQAPGLWILDPQSFLRDIEADLPGQRLSRSWDATSDSIAARLAQVGGARELVLLKSCSPPAGDLHHLAELGYVDRSFPQLAATLPNVRFVDLRGNTQGVGGLTAGN
ncbi:MAG: hypothetical protein J5I93_14665 [Pirellulaceae bacterium]|nr:hypothetical protein [Pirellulaceae bacterium]